MLRFFDFTQSVVVHRLYIFLYRKFQKRWFFVNRAHCGSFYFLRFLKITLHDPRNCNIATKNNSSYKSSVFYSFWSIDIRWYFLNFILLWMFLFYFRQFNLQIMLMTAWGIHTFFITTTFLSGLRVKSLTTMVLINMIVFK